MRFKIIYLSRKRLRCCFVPVYLGARLSLGLGAASDRLQWSLSGHPGKRGSLAKGVLVLVSGSRLVASEASLPDHDKRNFPLPFTIPAPEAPPERNAPGYLAEAAEAGGTQRRDSQTRRLQRRPDQGFPGKGNYLISTRAEGLPLRGTPPSSLLARPRSPAGPRQNRPGSS